MSRLMGTGAAPDKGFRARKQRQHPAACDYMIAGRDASRHGTTGIGDLTLRQRAHALAWVADLMAALFAVWAVR